MKRKYHNFIDQSVLMMVVFMGVAFSPFPSFSNEKSGPSVISLDYCADQFVLLLSDREQITAVSKAAEDVYSFYRERAKGIAKTDSTIEEVIMLNPDLAVQTYSSAAHMGEMTTRSDVSLVATMYGSDPETVYKNIAMVGKALEQGERANEFNYNYKRRLAALKNKPKSEIRLAYITPSGITAGNGTSVDDIIKLSGFENYTTKYGYNSWLSLPLENLIMDPPDAFITSFFERDAVTQSRWSLSRHDFLFQMMESIPTISIPSTYMSCNGLFHVDAAELVRQEAHTLELINETDEAQE